jgi:hypothetical protein
VGLLLVIAALAALIGTGQLHLGSFGPQAQAVPTPTVTATSAPAFQTYKDPSGLYSLRVPPAWGNAQNQTASYTLVSFVDPTENDYFQIETPSEPSASSAQALDDAFLGTLAQGSALGNRQGPQTVQVGGETWTQESGDASPTINGQPRALHAVVLCTTHAGHTVIVLYDAPAASFAAADSTAFQPMLASFTFLQ